MGLPCIPIMKTSLWRYYRNSVFKKSLCPVKDPFAGHSANIQHFLRWEAVWPEKLYIFISITSDLLDLDCDDYRVYNDLLIRNGNYTTQVDHIVISRYGVFVLETMSTGRFMAAVMLNSGSSICQTPATSATALPRSISWEIRYGRMTGTSRR